MDVAALEPFAAGGERGARHVGQIQHLALLGGRVFVQAQHLLGGQAGLTGALNGLAQRPQPADQAGFKAVEAIQLVAGGGEGR